MVGGDGRRVVVLRALPGVGDLLCAVPALRALRSAQPAARITLAGLPSSGWFVRRYSRLVDDLLAVEGITGLPEVVPQPAAAARFLERTQARRFDLAVQVHGSGVVTNPLMAAFGARHQVSAHLPGHWVPPGTSIEYPRDLPEIARMLAVVAAAGCQPAGGHIELPIADKEWGVGGRLLACAGLAAHPYACVHPGASRPDRRWPVERFVEIADHLTRRGLAVVVTGSAAEVGLVRAVTGAMHSRAVDFAGRTGIGVLGAVYRNAHLVVTNDTAASHVAAAVRTPSVVVIGSDEPGRWAPLDADRHRAVTGDPPSAWPDVETVVGTIEAQLTRWPPAADRPNPWQSEVGS
jgi:ADP-heptose:LPS heptosyltransferase